MNFSNVKGQLGLQTTLKNEKIDSGEKGKTKQHVCLQGKFRRCDT